MAFYGSRDFLLEVVKGLIPGHASINKFGRTKNADNGVATDVWDRANVADDQPIWVAPTQARIHNIASDNAADTSAGAGARTIRIYGLADWDTPELTPEDITLNGITNVATANSYVIIHRMQVLTSGATSINVGTITATAQTDDTVTTQIEPSQGQTQMAIWGWPSTQTAYVYGYYASMNKSGGAAAGVDVSFQWNPNPDAQLTNFRVTHTRGVISTGTSAVEHNFRPPAKLAGPGIIKVQVEASANDIDVSAGFDVVLVDN